jgi:hypothetical protein
LIDAAGESWGRVRAGKKVAAVCVDAWRAAKSVVLGGFVGVDDLVVDDEFWVVFGERFEVDACFLPAGAILEIQQRDVHEFSVPTWG